VAKGISKCEIKKTLQNAMYKNCLFGETTTINLMKCIRCVNHELYVKIINKKGLCSFDDKRYWKNHIESYAFEHYKIYSPTKVKHHLTCFNNIFSNNELITMMEWLTLKWSATLLWLKPPLCMPTACHLSGMTICTWRQVH
jgi:hypothetical protein